MTDRPLSAEKRLLVLLILAMLSGCTSHLRGQEIHDADALAKQCEESGGKAWGLVDDFSQTISVECRRGQL